MDAAMCRNSQQRYSVKKVFLKISHENNIAKYFTGKHLCWGLFLIKLQACNFIKKRLQHRCFLVKYAIFLRTTILKNICERLHQCDCVQD